MTVIIVKVGTHRINGFLRGTMLEISTGVYIANFNVRVREKIIEILTNWYELEKSTSSFVIVWQDAKKAGGLTCRVFGAPTVDLVELDEAFWLPEGIEYDILIFQ